jgi:hypothetical protein
MDQFKSWIESKAVWGGIAAVAGAALSLGHYTLTPADAAHAVDLVTGIVTAIGGLVAIYGRVVASKKIGSA